MWLTPYIRRLQGLAPQDHMAFVKMVGMGRAGGGGGGGRRGESTVEITWGMNVDANCAVGYRACVARAP